MRNVRFFFYLILSVSALYACRPESNRQRASGEAAALTQAQLCRDSCHAFLPQMQQAYDSLIVVNEFEALKIRNNLSMMQENLVDLENLLNAEPAQKEALLPRMQSQVSYLYALMASGRAMLREDSQSFGEWEQTVTPVGDSVMTPVKKAD
jgi:hypothetical protein